jgi:hypothetical protein
MFSFPPSSRLAELLQDFLADTAGSHVKRLAFLKLAALTAQGKVFDEPLQCQRRICLGVRILFTTETQRGSRSQRSKRYFTAETQSS